MKKLLLFFIILTVSNSIKSQTKFCEPGAQWRYLFHDYFEGYDIAANMTYLNDTIIGSDTIKNVDVYSFFKRYEGGSITQFMQKGDTVFFATAILTTPGRFFTILPARLIIPGKLPYAPVTLSI